MRIIKAFKIIIFCILCIYSIALSEKYIGVNGPATQIWSGASVDMGAENIVHWDNLDVNWKLNSNGAGDGLTYNQTQSAIGNSFNSWQNISTSNINFNYSGSTSNTWSYEGDNVHFWAESGDPIFVYLSGFLAVTIITINASEEFLDVDIVFNGRDYTWKTDGSNYDIQAVSTHEIGHLIGLHHTEIYSSPLPTMYPYYFGIDERSLEWDDQVGASFLYRGNLIDNETFSGTDYYNWSLILSSGKTLTISAGSTLKFASGVSLTVNGVINAQGTQANPIQFTSVTGTPSYWDVRVQNGNSIFKYCKFEFGFNPLRLYYATSGNTTLIENCIFKNSLGGWGLYIIYSNAKVKSCEFVSNNYYAIYCYSSTVDFIGNWFHNNYVGIYSIGNNSLDFYGNVIENNSYYGICTGDADIVSIGEPYTWAGKNTVRNNGSYEVYAGPGTLSLDLCGSSIHGSGGSDYEVYNYPGNYHVYALDCWWNTDGCQYSGSVTRVNSHNALPNDPSPPNNWEGVLLTAGSPLGKTAGVIASEKEDFLIDPSLPKEERVRQAKAIIASVPDKKEALEALTILYGILRADYVENVLGEKDTFMDYLETLRVSYPDKAVWVKGRSGI